MINPYLRLDIILDAAQKESEDALFICGRVLTIYYITIHKRKKYQLTMKF